MSRRLVAGLVATLGLLLWGCPKPVTEMEAFKPRSLKDYSKPLPPGALALRKIDPSRYPDFGLGFDNLAGLEQAIRNSLAYLAKPSSQKYFPYGDITHERAVRSLERFLDVIHAVNSPQELNQRIRNEFDVYQSVGCDDRGTVYFTGYYTPIFEGRRQRDGQYRYPLYGLPPDLVKDEEGTTLGRKRPDGGLDPVYPTRREIEQGRLLDGLEVAWVKDPFEAYVITVQGSAKLRQADSTIHEIGYSGNNGHEYTPIAEAMIQDGAIKREELSLQTLLHYFGQHRDHVYSYAWKNDRYVFFKDAPGGPFGSLGQPVTAFRSIATDKQVYPRACLAFLNTTMPTSYTSTAQGPYSSFACDQDTGGAIRAAGRCDAFMGVGPTAEAIAGRTGAEGGLYYVFVK